jgi:hypothetical protein
MLEDASGWNNAVYQQHCGHIGSGTEAVLEFESAYAGCVYSGNSALSGDLGSNFRE